MSLEALDRFVNVKFAHMNTLIRGATGERSISLPVDIQCGCTVKAKLLSALATRGIPNNCCLVDTSAKNIIATFVPF